MFGHGRPNIKVSKVPQHLHDRTIISDPDAANKSLYENATGEGEEAQRCVLQYRRLQQIVHRLRRKAANFPSHNNPKHDRERSAMDKRLFRKTRDDMNKGAVTVITHFINKANGHESDLEKILAQGKYNDSLSIPPC